MDPADEETFKEMGNEAQEPVGNSDTSYFDTELEQFTRAQDEPAKEMSPLSRDKEYAQHPEKHPNFWFVWSDIPEKGRDTFLKQLSELLGLPWIQDANVEKSQAGASILVSLGKDSVSLELNIEDGSLGVFDAAGELLLEVTVREARRKLFCFTEVLCGRKRNTGVRCSQVALPESRMCTEHQGSQRKNNRQVKSLAISKAPNYMSLPVNAYYYWTTKRPDLVKLVDDITESFRLELKWDFTNPRLIELKYLAVQIVIRNLMTNKALEADFKSAVYDPETHEVVGFKAHFLLDKVSSFDSRIMQKLKDFGIIVPPSRTEKGDIVPIELRFLWTPMPEEKPKHSIDVEANIVDAETKEVKDGQGGDSGHQ